MRGFGLDFSSLSKLNPQLIYASISGYGQTGPSAKKGGFDLVAQGVSGIMAITGEPGRSPVKAGIPVTDLGAGLFALSGIVVALFHRTKTGHGQHIDTSLVEAGVSLSVWEATEYFSGAGIPKPMGVGSSHDRALSGDPMCGRLYHAWDGQRPPFPPALRAVGPRRVGQPPGLRRQHRTRTKPSGACRADRSDHRAAPLQALALRVRRARDPVRADQIPTKRS